MTVADTNAWDKHLPGRTPENPFKIVALLNSRAVGDTIFYHTFSASVKRLFDHASLTIYQRDDRHYKRDMLDMNAEVDDFFVAAPEARGVTIDSFQMIGDIVSKNEPIPRYVFIQDRWRESRSNRPHLILSPTGMPEEMLGAFENPAYMRIPDDRVEQLEIEFLGHGIDPDRWFCVLNYREPGYQLRPSRTIKDLDPKPFMALVEYIIETLGGQVVRVGHPNMTPFPVRPGFVDLAMLEDSFMLHAFAISRARFMVGSLTGISHLGSAMNTPTAITNCISPPFSAGCWGDQDIALYLNLYEPNGRRVDTAEQHKMEIYDRGDLIDLVENHGYKLFENNANELALTVHELMKATMDCQTWRAPSRPLEIKARPNRFDFPMDVRMRNRIVEFPDHASAPA
jgi:putative glycosyltransferase (TIGR04372 family)